MLSVHPDSAFALGILVGGTYGALTTHWFLEKRATRKVLQRLGRSEPAHRRLLSKLILSRTLNTVPRGTLDLFLALQARLRTESADYGLVDEILSVGVVSRERQRELVPIRDSLPPSGTEQ